MKIRAGLLVVAVIGNYGTHRSHRTYPTYLTQTMVRSVLVLVVLMLVGSSVSAQPSRSAQLEQRVAFLKKELGLSDQATAALRRIFEKDQAQLHKDREAYNNATDTNRKAARKKLNADRKSMLAELKSILTAEQIKKFNALRNENWETKGERHRKRS
jgi:protein CpxP